MNILVTGANGFIGQRLCRRLEGCGHRVTKLNADITQPFGLVEHFDLVIHLAAYNITSVGLKDAQRYESVNVRGTAHVIQAVKASRFIYLSTVRVYKNEGKPLTEASPVAPHGAYEQSKLKAEAVCQELLARQNLVILRSVNVIGFGQAPKAVVPVFFQKAHAQEPLDILNASLKLQLIYVEDLIDAIEAVIVHDQAQGIYNVGCEEPVTLEDLAQRIIAETQSSSRLDIKERRELDFAPVMCRKAHHELGWRTKTSLALALKNYEKEYAQTL